jgi:hypothetical protein
MEQQQQIESDKQFMSANGWQCKPYSKLSVPIQARFMRRDITSMRRDRERSSGSVQNRHHDYYEDIEEEQDGDSELVKTIKRLRKNKINCQPDNYLDTELQAMMRQGKMSLNDALRLMQANQEQQRLEQQQQRLEQQQQIEPLHSPPAPSPPRPPVAAGSEVDIVDIEAAEEAAEAAQVAHLKKLTSAVAFEAADKVASQETRNAQEYFSDLLAGRFKKAPSSPIDIPSRKKGGKKRSYKKRTNAKKRSTKKRTNAKKRSYKKRN